MPTYVYEVIQNGEPTGERFEVVQPISEDPLTEHPETGEPVERVITGGCGVVFHGPSIMSMNVPRGKK